MTRKYQVCMEHILPSDLAESCILLRGLGEKKSPLPPPASCSCTFILLEDCLPSTQGLQRKKTSFAEKQSQI